MPNLATVGSLSTCKGGNAGTETGLMLEPLPNWTVGDYLAHYHYWPTLETEDIRKKFPMTSIVARLSGTDLQRCLIHPEDIYWLNIRAIQTGRQLLTTPPPPF
jgi:hypothetical protein